MFVSPAAYRFKLPLLSCFSVQLVLESGLQLLTFSLGENDIAPAYRARTTVGAKVSNGARTTQSVIDAGRERLRLVARGK